MTERLITAVLFNRNGLEIHREPSINFNHLPDHLVFRDRIFTEGGFDRSRPRDEIFYYEEPDKVMTIHEVPVPWAPIAQSEITEEGRIRLIVFSENYLDDENGQTIIDIIEWEDADYYRIGTKGVQKRQAERMISFIESRRFDLEV